MGWLIAIAVILLIAVFPLGICAKYNADGPLVYVTAGPLRFKVYPEEEKPKEAKKAKKAKKKPQGEAATPAAGKKKKGGNVPGFLQHLDLILDLLGDLRRKVRVKRLEMKLIMAGDDPCDLAINYGRAWAVVGNLMPLLERVFVIKKRDVEVECDFTATETLITARLDITITFGRLLALAAVYGVRALQEYRNKTNTKKGGAVK